MQRQSDMVDHKRPLVMQEDIRVNQFQPWKWLPCKSWALGMRGGDVEGVAAHVKEAQCPQACHTGHRVAHPVPLIL